MAWTFHCGKALPIPYLFTLEIWHWGRTRHALLICCLAQGQLPRGKSISGARCRTLQLQSEMGWAGCASGVCYLLHALHSEQYAVLPPNIADSYFRVDSDETMGYTQFMCSWNDEIYGSNGCYQYGLAIGMWNREIRCSILWRFNFRLSQIDIPDIVPRNEDVRNEER